jgi:HD-GYP domain-containing protein (c-di-GMP phosphodiesterase class II)
MLRRFFTNETSGGDTLSLINSFFEIPSTSERNSFVLEHLCETFAGEVRGLSIGLHQGQTVIHLSKGYSSDLKDLKVNGVAQDSTPRLVTSISELFSQSTNETLYTLTQAGVLEARTTLLVPIQRGTGDKQGPLHGFLLLQRFDGKLTEADLKITTQWGTLLATAHELRQNSDQARQSLIEFSKAFMEAIESQDFKQLGHAERVTQYALALGRAKGLSRQELFDLYFAAMFHDVGKLGSGLDLSIEDPNHPQRGANMFAASSLLETARDAIRAHHEHWDGSGFPNRLMQEQIPLFARIVTVADTFDFLSSERGQALTLNEVEKALALRAHRQLDPELVTLFKEILRQGKSTKALAELNEEMLY